MSCIANINPLYNSYFTLRFGRGTQQFELNCQKANLPGCTIPETSQPTIFGTTIPVPTMQFNYETLNVEFIVDSELTNWKSIYSWMRNLANIATDQDIAVNSGRDNNTEGINLPYQDWHHEATLTLYDPANKCPSLAVTFRYIIPTRLSGMVFQSDSADAIIQKASCQFKFSYYELNPDAPGNLKYQR
jgi:hypothetical protein